MAIEDIRPLAVVTGGSSGIGYEFARRFLENGYDVVIAADDPGRLGEAQQALEAMGLGAVEAVEADLATPDGVEELFEVATEMGPIDVLCCNEGYGAWGKFGEDSELEEEIDLIQRNCTGLAHLTRLVLPDMLERDRGQILFTGAVTGEAAGPYHAVQHASRAFVAAFCQALKGELKDTGVEIAVQMGRLDDPGGLVNAAFEALPMSSGQAAAEGAEPAGPCN